jgi:LysM repeat protein
MSDMTGTDRRTRPRPRLAGAALASLPVVLALVAGACGTTDKASTEPLPPIRTTTSTTTIPGTTLPEGVRQFYTIKRGDTLAIIAGATGVTVQSIIVLNNIDDPDAIQAGQTIEIPAGIVVITDLDALVTTVAE